MAKARAELNVDFQISWHPYFLDFHLPAAGLTKRESYRKKGMSDVKLLKMERKMSDLFHAEGIEYTLEGPIGNTLDSHCLAAWAYTKYGAAVQDRLVEVIFRMYFTEQQNPADHAVLLRAAAEVGMDVDAAKEYLEAGTGQKSVLRAAQDIMSDSPATGVPHYFLRVDGTTTQDRPRGVISQVPGAQERDTFFLAIQALVKKAQAHFNESAKL